jgi:hypothetical protein
MGGCLDKGGSLEIAIKRLQWKFGFPSTVTITWTKKKVMARISTKF